MSTEVQRRAAAPPRASGYLPGLDGLRAVSVIAVLLYHGDMPWLDGGFLGVEVFFVISGYLITLLLTQEYQRTDTISLQDFWLRRARRLLAAVYTLLATVSIFVLLFDREEASKLAGQVWAALFYVTNWYLIVSDQSYFALTERPPVFQHLWSLAIEEQFYLVWPLVVLGLLRVFKGRHLPIAGVCVAGAIASLVWMAILFEPAMDPSRAYYGTDTRASGLLLGAALALVFKPGHQFRSDAATKGLGIDLLGFLGLGIVIGCFVQFHSSDAFLFQGGFALLSVATLAMVAAAVHPGTMLGRVAGLSWLTAVGKRSYSLYLWHWPIFVFTQPEIDWPLTLYPTLAVRLALTVVLAELSYRFVEVPVRNWAFGRWRARLRRRHGARRTTGPIVLGSTAALILVAVTVAGSASSNASMDQLVGQGGEPPAAEVSSPTSAPSPTSSDGSTGSADVTTTTIAGAVTTAAPGSTATSVGAAVTSTTSNVPTTPPGPMAKTVTVLGDSVLLGAEDQLTAELEASGYTVDYRAVAAQMLHQGNKALLDAGTPVGETVVIGLGHNSLWERDRQNYDKWARKFNSEADILIQTLEGLGATKIVWVTLREPSEDVIPPEGRKQYDAYVWYFPYVNEQIDQLPTRHPDLVVADWAAVSNESGLTYDAMHLTSSGIRLMIDTIRNAGQI